jgi:pimeloyl-ACP methyl ester carboxylesterase
MVSVVRIVVTALLAGLATVPLAAGPAVAADRAGSDVVRRTVLFETTNVNTTGVPCSSDGKARRLRATLVGPRNEVLASTADRVNVLVHDRSTGSWFWNLRSNPAYDYATKLAARGETSLVLDRLGYDANPLADGNNTCLGAQATMLHQIVQHLRAGKYSFATSQDKTPSAVRVVLHGHAVGAAIAQLEAATFDDVDGLALMSWVDGGASDRAREDLQQTATCLDGEDYAHFGTRREFRRLYFTTAPRRIRRVATERRNPGPCGDVLSLAQMELASAQTTREVEPPVLLLYGSKDAMIRKDAAETQADRYSSAERVTTRTTAGAGNALVLEETAPRTRRQVLRWLGSLDL